MASGPGERGAESCWPIRGRARRPAQHQLDHIPRRAEPERPGERACTRPPADQPKRRGRQGNGPPLAVLGRAVIGGRERLGVGARWHAPSIEEGPPANPRDDG